MIQSPYTQGICQMSHLHAPANTTRKLPPCIYNIKKPSRGPKLKVIFVLHSHHSGGAERHLLELMRSLSLLNVECIYAGPMDSWLGEQVQALEMRYLHIAYHGFFDLLSLTKLVRLVRRERADLLHGHLTRGAFYAGWASSLTTVPSIATAHSTNAGKHFGKAKRIIAVSEAVHRFLVECNYPLATLRMILNGVPDYTHLPPASTYSVLDTLSQPDTPVLAMVARLVPAKGHDIALHALSRLKNRKWLLVIAGQHDTKWGHEIQELTHKLDLQNRVHFIGDHENVQDIYRFSDILLAPSRREAISLTLLEASSFSLPIVATDVGGIREAVINGETGLLVEEKDPVQLAQAVQTLLDDPNLGEILGKAGRQRYEKYFSSKTMTKKVYAIYKELV